MKLRKKQKNLQQRRQKNLKSNDYYVICGRNAVLDAIKSGRVEKVLVSESVSNDVKICQILQSVRLSKINYTLVKKTEIDKLTRGYDRNQGIVAVCKKASKLDFADFLHIMDEKENVCLVMLTEIEYEQNLGAILRTLDGAGVDGVIVSSRIKNYDSIVVRKVSMGASESVNIFVQSIFIALRNLKDAGYRIIGIESIGTKNYTEEDLSGKVVLVFGGEDKALTEPVMKVCDELVSIPMKGNVSSLNVSVSVAIAVYERLRQITN